MPQSVPLRKLVVELRYKPDLDFYGKMDGVATAFVDELPDWQRSPLTVEIRNKKKHRRMFLSHRRCFYESDLASGTSFSDFDFASGALERICNGLSITELQRIGVRQWFAADLNKAFACMVDEFSARFLNQSEELVAILTDKTEDLAYVVNFETTEGWKYHLRLGPMTRDEWFQRVVYEINVFESTGEENAATFEKFKTGFPDNFLYVDVDCFQEDVPASRLKELVTVFRRRSHDLVEKLIQYFQE